MRETATFTIYQEGQLAVPPDTARGWRWRLTVANGNITADGGEAYATAANARRAVKALLRGLGVNVAGPGWRARLIRDRGIWITERNS